MAPKPLGELVCPKPSHAGAPLWKRGVRKDASGRRWQRYECRPLVGSAHYVRLALVDETDEVESTVISPAPRCPVAEHREMGTTVIRDGSYGTRVKRQRYECYYIDEAGDRHEHKFVQALPRDHIGDRHLNCRECEELISVHKGSPASSRRSSWPMNGVVELLMEMSLGVSYGEASVNLWRKAEMARAHLETHEADEEADPETAGDAPAVDGPPAGAEVAGEGDAETAADGKAADSSSKEAAERRAAWHLGADLVEQYSPVLFAHTIADITAREQATRVENDRIKADGGVPGQPLTFVLDEVPVYIKLAGGASRVSWTILSVAEVLWLPGKKKTDPPRRVNRLRLARALPGPANAEAWVLVLHELGVTPDVVVADFAKSIAGAVDWYYRSDPPLRVPSLFHLIQGIGQMFREKPGYHRGKGRDKVIVPEFAEHLRLISRDWLVEVGVDGWRQWWKDFEALARAAKAPVTPLLNSKNAYLAPVAAAIPVLAAQPQLPASNSGIEVKNRNLLKPILRGRSQRYRNLARTNALLDLLVCRENGLFLDRAVVARLIREDNLAEENRGWATKMRTYDDRQPPALTDGDRPDPLAALWETPTAPTEPADDAAASGTDDADSTAEPDGTEDGEKPITRTRRKRQQRYASLLDPGLVPALFAARMAADGGELP